MGVGDVRLVGKENRRTAGKVVRRFCPVTVSRGGERTRRRAGRANYTADRRADRWRAMKWRGTKRRGDEVYRRRSSARCAETVTPGRLPVWWSGTEGAA